MLKKSKLLSLITAVCFICAAIIPCTFAEAEVVTLENIEVGGDEVQYVYLHNASQGKDSECEIVSGEIPGGMGLSEKLYETHIELLKAGKSLIESCPCPAGTCAWRTSTWRIPS